MRFWDASAVVPLVIDESTGPPIEVQFDETPMVVWWGTVVEATSAITRRERAGTMPAAKVAESLDLLLDLSSGWLEVSPSEPLRLSAQRLLRVHPLRAADSLQLAAALLAAADERGSVEFVCRDARLAEAAGREGLKVIGL
jgi:predicted nucleic acid-binding protein